VNCITPGEALLMEKSAVSSTPKGLNVTVYFQDSPIELAVNPSSTIKQLVSKLIEDLGEDPNTSNSYAVFKKSTRTRLLFTQLVADVSSPTYPLLLEKKK
jgi:hypothetical protein